LSESLETVFPRVRAVIADALDQSESSVEMHSSLIDDLGAESIDFLDIAFRLESEFGLRINGEELWAGRAGKVSEQGAIDEEVARLRERMPDFDWERLPAKITKRDLPRLITVRTVVDYIERRLTEAESGDDA